MQIFRLRFIRWGQVGVVGARVAEYDQKGMMTMGSSSGRAFLKRRKPVYVLAVVIMASLSGAGIASAQYLRFQEVTDSVKFEPGCWPTPDTATYEARFRLAGPQGFGEMYCEHAQSAFDRQLGVSTTGIYEYLHPVDNGSGWIVSVSITPNEWHHVAFCYDGSQERMYLDGTLIGFRPNAGPIYSACEGYGPPALRVASIGRIVRTDGYVIPSFLGDLDFIRISSVARYSGASFLPPSMELAPDSDTLLLYNFSECNGSTICFDLSSYQRHGLVGVGVGATAPIFSSRNGDLNGDSSINTLDVTLFTQVVLDPATPLTAADMNCDGNVDGLDVQGFVNALLGP